MPREDVLQFFREPRRFAGAGADGTASLWRAALEEVAVPAVTEAAFRPAQQAAWRGIAEHRAALVLGPPGTGKTFVLAWMALGYLELRRRRGLPCRILLTGFTRNSIANLLSAMHDKARKHGFGGTTFCWAGSEPPQEMPADIQVLDPADAVPLLDRPHLVMGTTSWSLYKLIEKARHPGADGLTAPLFDLVCIDEASQMVVSQGLMCLAGLAPGGRVLVAGDDRQLPPVRQVHEHEVDGRHIGGSLYAFLREAQVAEFRLDETFRLNAPLASFPSEHFYEGQYRSVNPEARLRLREGWEAGLSDWELEALDPARPVCILMHDGPAAGTHNPFEVGLVARLTQFLRERLPPEEGAAERSSGTFWNEHLAVVSPHRAQNAAIRDALRARKLGDECVVETVDRIQGRERDAIIASYTVSDPEFARAEAEFIFSPERFNVTITRARTKLILVIARRLLDVIPEDEEVFDAAQAMREFVYSSEDRGQVRVRGPDGVEWPVDVRVRSFDDTEALPRLEPRLDDRPAPEPVFELTPELRELFEHIQKVALNNSYGTAADFLVEKSFGRKPTLEELRALCKQGFVALELQPTKKGSTFWVARPLVPPRRPFPVDPDTARVRIEEVIEATRPKGRFAPTYEKVRERFDWVGPRGEDLFEPVLNALQQEGVVRTDVNTWGQRTIDLVETAIVAEGPPPPAEAIEEGDFELLNRLEEVEARRINFGVFEQWTTPRELVRALNSEEVRVSAALRRLADHGWVLLTEAGRVRSRAAELAREVRYVKQRFRQGDACRRPFLVRALKLELKDRDKPVRDRPLSGIETSLIEQLDGHPEAQRAVAGVAAMLRARFNKPDPELSGFQERALGSMVPTWLGLSTDDAFVITAETGTGKTEAGVLPLMVGAATDALRGVRGTRAVLVYPRIRLAANQAQRIAGYLAALARVPGMPLLTLGLQNKDVLGHFGVPDEEKGWRRGPGGAFTFPFFACPEGECKCDLWLQPGGGANGADLLRCPRCGWEYGGWMGSKRGVVAHPPHFFLPVTESLHQWMFTPDRGRLFGDKPPYAAPRAVLADEIHLYSHLHGAQVGYALRRLIARSELNRREHEGSPVRTLAIGMSATLGRPDEIWGALCGRNRVAIIRPEARERRPNPRGREYFYFVQPEVESRGHDIAGASTSIQTLMCLAHGMRRRAGDDGGFRGIAFLDSIDKLKRLHSDYADAEQGNRLARLRTRLFDDDAHTGLPRRECCGAPDACDRFRQGECWYFAARDRRQRTVRGPYVPGRALEVCAKPIFSKTGGRADELIQKSDLVFSTSSLEVGFDDPEMILVYQHYAPLNLASFIQRKGRGGRGSDDRPVTGVTLSTYSPRDSWFFRRPRLMLDASGFEVPLNVENYFVTRGQVVSLILDLAARRQSRLGSASGVDTRFLTEADAVVRTTFGDDVYKRLEVESLEQLWREATAGVALSPTGDPRKWAEDISWVPRLLFQSLNLPLLAVGYQSDTGEVKQDSEDITLAFSECAPGNMTRRFGFRVVHWIPPLPGRQPLWRPLGHSDAWPEFTPAGSGPLLESLPREARLHIGAKLHPQVVRPTSLEMAGGGRFLGTEWQGDWVYDEARREVLLSKEPSNLPRVNPKSQGRLRGFLSVEAEAGFAERRQVRLLGALASEVEVFRGTAARGKRTGLKVARVFWGADARLVLETSDRKREEAYVSQVFAHPDDEGLLREADRRTLLHGYELETEGVRVRLDGAVLDDFVRAESARLEAEPTEAKWFRGQFLRYLLMSGGASGGLNPYQVRQIADLMVTAAAFEGFSKDLQKLLRRWDGGLFAKLLTDVFQGHLRQHPMLTEQRLERLGEVIASTAFQRLIDQAWRDVRSHEAFTGYLRSVVVHGLAIRLEQAFVRHGRGDERRVLFHVKLPVQFGGGSEDVITVAEDGSHGDGTTRTFVAHLDEAASDLTPELLADCPNAREDRFVAALAGRPAADIARWRSWDPRDERRVRELARELGADLDVDAGPFQGVLRLLYGAEEVDGDRFELFTLYQELQAAGGLLAREMGREPSAWELVGTLVARAERGDAGAAEWRRLLERYRGVEEAVQEESLSAEARIADQAYRLTARLCVDGCQACLHTGSSLMNGDMAEVAVSRRLLERLGAFLRRRASPCGA
ncbi:AAA domain-containing protein [Myxococcus sp. AM010]|uniref:AAA domain-containing protein n=1 Tax=Myxococcus sp. AM010 TaxID=2745138 RepID=UPI001595058D|nr:AAA domain-containing protein [Myxococcus sp. AM010]NVJ15318.1 AAA family ATPase [Myxococcus sp. AM010]